MFFFPNDFVKQISCKFYLISIYARLKAMNWKPEIFFPEWFCFPEYLNVTSNVSRARPSPMMAMMNYPISSVEAFFRRFYSFLQKVSLEIWQLLITRWDVLLAVPYHFSFHHFGLISELGSLSRIAGSFFFLLSIFVIACSGMFVVIEFYILIIS